MSETACLDTSPRQIEPPKLIDQKDENTFSEGGLNLSNLIDTIIDVRKKSERIEAKIQKILNSKNSEERRHSICISSV